jgi:hypothetical protein
VDVSPSFQIWKVLPTHLFFWANKIPDMDDTNDGDGYSKATPLVQVLMGRPRREIEGVLQIRIKWGAYYGSSGYSLGF